MVAAMTMPPAHKALCALQRLGGFFTSSAEQCHKRECRQYRVSVCTACAELVWAYMCVCVFVCDRERERERKRERERERKIEASYIGCVFSTHIQVHMALFIHM